MFIVLSPEVGELCGWSPHLTDCALSFKKKFYADWWKFLSILSNTCIFVDLYIICTLHYMDHLLRHEMIRWNKQCLKNSFHNVFFNSIGDLFVLIKISWLVIFSIRAVWVDIFYYFQHLDLVLCVTVIQMSGFNSLILGLSSWKGTLRCVESSGRSS